MATASGPMPLIPDTPPQSVETLGPSIVMPRFQSMEQAQPESDIQVVNRGYNGGIQPSSFNTLDVPKPLPKIPTLMKIMSTVAAVKGNPGPMMQLMQQERSMEAFNAIIPHVSKANSLVAQGKHAEAIKVMEGLAPQIGIAPEIAQYIQPLMEKIYESQKTTQYADAIIASLELDIAEHPEDEKRISTNKAMMKKAKVGRNLPTQKHFEDYMKHHASSFHLDTNSKSLLETTSSGIVRQHRIPQTFDGKIFDTPAGQKFTSDFGMPAHELTNIINGVPVIKGGQDVTPAMQPIVNQAIAKLPGFESQRTLAKDTTWTPEYNQALYQELMARNIAPEIANTIIASKGAGVDPGVLSNIHTATVARMQGQRIEMAIAPLEAGSQVPLEKSPDQKGFIAIDQDDESGTWGRRVSGVSVNDIIGSKGKLGRISETVYNENIVPSLKAIDALDMVPAMMRSAERPEGDVDRLTTGLARKYARWAGTADPKAAKLEAVSVILSRQIENILDTKAVKTEDAAILKRIISGPFNSEASALAAVAEVKNVLKRNAKQHMDSNVQIPPRPGVQSKATMDDLSKAGTVKPVTIKGEKKGVSATYQPYPVASSPEVKVIQETVNGLIANRLKIPGQKALKGDYVSNKDSLLVAQRKLADANIKALELEGKQRAPDQGLVTTLPEQSVAPSVAPSTTPTVAPTAPDIPQASKPAGQLHFDRAKKAQ